MKATLGATQLLSTSKLKEIFPDKPWNKHHIYKQTLQSAYVLLQSKGKLRQRKNLTLSGLLSSLGKRSTAVDILALWAVLVRICCTPVVGRGLIVANAGLELWSPECWDYIDIDIPPPYRMFSSTPGRKFWIFSIGFLRQGLNSLGWPGA